MMEASRWLGTACDDVVCAVQQVMLLPNFVACVLLELCPLIFDVCERDKRGIYDVRKERDI